MIDREDRDRSDEKYPQVCVQATVLSVCAGNRAKCMCRQPCFSGGQCQAADEETMNLADGLNSSEWQTIIPQTPLKPGYQETRWYVSCSRHSFLMDSLLLVCLLGTLSS